MGRTPPGVRGLKFATDGTWADIMPSHPTRGAWIEIRCLYCRPHEIHHVAPHPGCVD